VTATSFGAPAGPQPGSPPQAAPAPPPEISVRPPDLLPAQREALRSADRGSARGGGGWAELPALVLVALVLAFLIKTFLVQAFYIPSGSMLETLQINDRVLVEKLSFRFGDPERGDVIVFRRPDAPARTGPGAVVRSFLEGIGLVAPNEEIDLIKRVVGLPGETVEIVDGRVLVDGVALAEPYVIDDQRSFPPVTVPEGEYYMLGDNRANSDDSRYSLGTVPRENVVGRAFVILWPPRNATLRLGHDHDEVEAPAEEVGAAAAPGLADCRPPRLPLSSAVGAPGVGALVPDDRCSRALADERPLATTSHRVATSVHRPEAIAP
jgi:signal peptidase I